MGRGRPVIHNGLDATRPHWGECGGGRVYRRLSYFAVGDANVGSAPSGMCCGSPPSHSTAGDHPPHLPRRTATPRQGGLAMTRIVTGLFERHRDVDLVVEHL